MKKYVCDPCGYVYDPEAAIRTTELPPEQPLRICPRIGCAPSAE